MTLTDLERRVGAPDACVWWTRNGKTWHSSEPMTITEAYSVWHLHKELLPMGGDGEALIVRRVPEPTPPQQREQEKCCAASGTYACVCNRFAVAPQPREQVGGDGVPVEVIAAINRALPYARSADRKLLLAWLASRGRG